MTSMFTYKHPQQYVCTVEQTLSCLRKRKTRGLLYVTDVWSSEITASKSWGKINTHTRTHWAPCSLFFISRQSFFCLPSSPWKFPMALQEVTITHLYDIWRLQTVSTDTGLPFSRPRVVKHWDFCPLLPLSSDNVTKCDVWLVSHQFASRPD